MQLAIKEIEQAIKKIWENITTAHGLQCPPK